MKIVSGEQDTEICKFIKYIFIAVYVTTEMGGIMGNICIGTFCWIEEESVNIIKLLIQGNGLFISASRSWET